MSAFSKDKYPQNIELACNMYHIRYSKTDESDSNGNKGNDKGQDKNNDDDDNDEKKDRLVSAHISMDSAAAILTAHASNDSMWETTDDDDIGSLVGEEDLVCCHFNVPHLEELDEECDDI